MCSGLTSIYGWIYTFYSNHNFRPIKILLFIRWESKFGSVIEKRNIPEQEKLYDFVWFPQIPSVIASIRKIVLKVNEKDTQALLSYLTRWE